MSNRNDNAQIAQSLSLASSLDIQHTANKNIRLVATQHSLTDQIGAQSSIPQSPSKMLLFSRYVEQEKAHDTSYKKMKKTFKKKLRTAKATFMPAFLSLAEIYTTIHTTRQYQERVINLDELSIYQLQESAKNLQHARQKIINIIAAGHEHFTELTTQKYAQFLVAYKRGAAEIAEYRTTTIGKKLDQHLSIYHDSARYFQRFLLKDYKNKRESLPKILYHLNNILQNADIDAIIKQRLIEASNKGKKRFKKTKTILYNAAKTNKIFAARYRYEIMKISSNDDDFPHYLARKKGEYSTDYYCVKIWLKETHKDSTLNPLYINYVNVKTGSIIISQSWRNSDRTQSERASATKFYIADPSDASVQPANQDESTIGALNHSKIVRQTLRLLAKNLHRELPDITSLTRYMVVNNDTVALVQAICRKAGIAPGQTLKLKQGTPAYFAIFDTPNGKGMPFLLNPGRSILHINIISGDEKVIEELEFVFG